ncbi:hypothetical protein CSOJ01_11529 [Colletotrichum sojae]|uniref:Uncharacterized protein n=1 Tax=Colletotrichum sojae TaxID=2175907 RepID=A0A8H6IXF7_9PEZI|nr:hypothetical protein CSOJ01_11529 [Colletotrichum sojae]
MFDHFTLGMQAHSAAAAAREEPHLSPRQRPRELDSSPLSVAASLPAIPSTPPQPIDNLAHELSKQTLFPDALLRPRPRRLSPGTSPSLIADLSAVALEADDDCAMDLSMADIAEHQPVADWKRSRRQWHSRFANNPNNARAIESRLSDMISDKSQCNVRQPPTTASKSVPQNPSLPQIEADGSQDLEPCARIEPDEDFCAEVDSQSMMHRLLAANREHSMGPDGATRRYGALRFRGSAETALRCQNVVRHRPRMRKRKGVGPTQEPRPTTTI